MYRQASQLSRAKSFLPSPASDELSDFDSDLMSILDAKRRAIEDEIEAFKSRKEKEFRTFEDQLRSRRTRNQNMSLSQPTSQPTSQPISSISGLSKLRKNEPNANTSEIKVKKKKADDVTLIDQKPTPAPSKALVSVERVTINGMTTPPISGTPPQGINFLALPTYLSAAPPRISSEKETDKLTTLPERENEFHGLFTPGYLQLLDSKPSSLPPPNSTSPSMPQFKRALTASPRPSNSLPSALKTASGTARKRKHVTFRLAPSVVVDPSSSYEETPSPSDDQYEHDSDDLDASWGDELPSGSLPIQIPRLDSYEALTSPTKTDKEASFFAFDEELDDPSDQSSEYQNVSEISSYQALSELTLLQDQEGGVLDFDTTEGQQAERPQLESPTFSSGSLPINIVNHSSSFREALRS
jgi:hypothetical protein